MKMKVLKINSFHIIQLDGRHEYVFTGRNLPVFSTPAQQPDHLNHPRLKALSVLPQRRNLL